MVRVIFKDSQLRQFTFDLAQTDTISDVKSIISSSLDIPAENQRLIHHRKELLDDQSVSECLGDGYIVYVLRKDVQSVSRESSLDNSMDDNSLLNMTLESNSYLKNISQDNPDIMRAVNDLMSDPQLLIQAAKAAVNPSIARELARTTDRAVQNVEAIPGGFQALYNLHTKLHDPLWNAASSAFRDDTPPKMKYYEDDRLAPLEAQSLPNPWKQSKPVVEPPTSTQPPQQGNNQATSTSSNLPILNYTDVFYRQQADLLMQMGFTDHAKCLAAVEEANGDISMAIDILTQTDQNGSH